MEVHAITKTLTYKGKSLSFPEEVGLQSPTSTVVSSFITNNTKFFDQQRYL